MQEPLSAPGPLRRVTVERNRLRFAAAHMATFGGDCEPLHGHNYSVLVAAEGELTDDAWVIDFGVLKRLTRELCDQLDHKVLLQTESPVLTVDRDGDQVQAVFRERRYLFPATDVFALPADNSTAERIAEYLWKRLSERLRAEGEGNLSRLLVEVEEAPGQSAAYGAFL